MFLYNGVNTHEKPSDKFPAADSASYFVLQEIVHDTVLLFESNRKECAKYLLGLHNNFESGIFATQTSEGSDKGNEEQKDVIMEQAGGWVLSEIVLEVSDILLLLICITALTFIMIARLWNHASIAFTSRQTSLFCSFDH